MDLLGGPKTDNERAQVDVDDHDDDDDDDDDGDDEYENEEEEEQEEEEDDEDGKGKKKSSSTPSRCESDRGYSSPKVSYAKSLSLPGATDDASPKLPLSKSKKQLQRLVSWSRYLEVRGNEQGSQVEAEEWMIDLSKLLLGPKFASGAHSRLYHGIYQGQAVAVKVTRHPQACSDTTGLKATLDRLFATEVSFLSKLHHPNLVQFIGACKKPPVNCLVTEYLAGGSLRDFLTRSTSPLPLHTVVGMALDIARGMNYLHSQGVVHRDLKSSNLILTHDLSVKITDLGVAALDSECDNVTSEVGTYRWMAPELVNRKPHSPKVDIYSFGIVMWELLARQVPFQDMNPIQAAYAVVNKNARPPLPPNCPSLLCQLMEQCWSSNPSNRPDFDLVLQTLNRFQNQQNGS